MKIKILDKTITFDGGVLWTSILLVALAIAVLSWVGFTMLIVWRGIGLWLPGGIVVLTVLGVIVYPCAKKLHDGWDL